ncbi:MAG: metallophosphoesterase [Planctomycetota bacterium]
MLRRFFVALVLVSLLALVVPVTADEAPGAFRFSVMGDNRPPGGEDVITQPEEFHQAIREVNFLRPDLVLVLGDLIMGYDPDEALVKKEWDAFFAAIERFAVPVKLVAGNHDVWDAKSRETYLKRVGPLHYAFDHKGCRFLVLNSEDIDHPERIEGEQLEWLTAELAKGGSARTFVFLHKPFWRYDPGSTNWMEDVHPLLAKAKVEAVFAGHWHNYERSDDRDGVRYYITGGAGAEIGGNVWAGDFHHHLLVDVPAERAKPARVHVLKTGFLEDDGIVTETERQRAWELTQALVPVGVTAKEGVDADSKVVVKATNPWSEPLLVRYELVAEKSGGWKLLPDPSQKLLTPGKETEIPLRFLNRGGELFPGPTVRITGRRGDELVVNDEMPLAVRFDRKLAIAEAASAIQLDGRLDEAAWSSRETAGSFLRIDGSGYAKRPTQFRACRDGEALYLSFRCEQPGADALEGGATDRDWPSLAEDCVIFYLDPVRDGKSRYCLGVTAQGVQMDYRAPGGAVDRAWNPEWGCAVSRDPKGWNLEVRIPFSLIEMEVKPGAELGLNAVRLSTAGEREFSAWSIPAGRLSNPAGFGDAVLK